MTSEDIDELKKLVSLVETGTIELIVTPQLQDEFYRNRSAKITDAMKKLKECNFNVSFPVFAKTYPEYDEIRDLMKKADQKHNDLMKKLSKDISDSNIIADSIVSSLFEKGKKLSHKDKIYLEALKRTRLGNPPGKKDSLGDAVNWEYLIDYCPLAEELYFVSGDKDYRSLIEDGRMNEFLKKEWADKKSSEIQFYGKLSDFFKDKFPHIKVSSDVGKDTAIAHLENSWSYAETHRAIADLEQYDNFSDEQIKRISNAIIENSQVKWIAEDADVSEFYSKIAKNYKTKIDSEKFYKILSLIKISEEELEKKDI